MAKQTQNWGAFVLEFLGSLAYLFVAFAVPGGLLATAGGVFGGSAGLWLPFFLGAAVIGSIALFFISFGNLLGWDRMGIAKAAMCATVAAGFALTVLVWTNTAYLATALLGFVLAFIGSGLAYK
ncbi:MAG: hypothetical protein ACP5GD_02445 [Candidatus Micrarchaeia archaeon]|jgi:hypothetical protein